MGSAAENRTPASVFGEMAAIYALVLWAREYRNHGFLPPATITGRWTNEQLPGGFQDFHGSVGIEDIPPRVATTVPNAIQNATIADGRGIAKPFATSKRRRNRRNSRGRQDSHDTRRLGARQIMNSTQGLNATQKTRLSVDNVVPTDPWTTGDGSGYVLTFSRFRQRYLPVIDIQDLSIDCLAMILFKVQSSSPKDLAILPGLRL